MLHKRSDISDYVIHFLRKQQIKDLPAVFEYEDKIYFAEDNDIGNMNEMECLFNIVSEGGLRGSFSFRNGKATIYGYTPTVCFTEMPLINLLEYRRLRKNPYRISDYGIAVKKRDLFKKGGRPVIYGLSPDNAFEFSEDIDQNPAIRIIKETIVPIKEQYRYVAFQLGGNKEIDWTHEREWRIAGNDEICPYNGTYDEFYHGMYLFDVEDFEEVVFIVKTKQDAIELERYVRPKRDSNYTRSGEFTTKLKFLVLDLAIEIFSKRELKKIEDLPNDVFYNFDYVRLNQKRITQLHEIIEHCKLEAKRIGEEYLEKHKDTGFCGWCNIVSHEADNPTVRYLFEQDMVFVYDGCYALKDIFNLAPHPQTQAYHIHVAEKVCAILNEKYENIFCVIIHDD
ncbi:hypothetical protein ACR782_07130 [Sphingobacterium spiritivorum]|uniref:hypothetical protein n=1 Tax=Sphingobacterium spiritivorum TaxID=258 RepID=UPI003DA32255